jgi:hypothetical protein
VGGFLNAGDVSSVFDRSVAQRRKKSPGSRVKKESCVRVVEKRVKRV